LEAADCPEPAEPGRRAICTNEGRCGQAGRPPRLLVEQPAQNTRFPFESGSVTVAGRVVVETPEVRVAVTARGRPGCVAESLRSVRLENPTPGAPTEIPFTIDGIPINPGASTVEVIAEAGVASQRYPVDVERQCVGCPEVTIESPRGTPVLAERFIPRLTGRITPAPGPGVRWRVLGERGQVFDGPLRPVPGDDGSAIFELGRVPTFDGLNRVDVIAPVEGGFEGSCSTAVLAPASRPRGARAVLTWDTEADLDLVWVGPGATLDSPGGVVSPSRMDESLSARVSDDFDGFGPELLIAGELGDGAYGILVEPITDEGAGGSSGIVRLTFEDRLLTERPLGPRFTSAARGDLWVVGALRVEDGAARFVEVDRVVSLDDPPARPPTDWPELW